MLFTYIDLFSGIGGFHQAASSLGGKCVLASEIDKNAIHVYKTNYGIDSGINIRELNNDQVPDHDLLCAGFPCQTFSKAGKREGFLDRVRGTLFFEVARIIEAKHPRFILLENVRNLVSHDDGNTYSTICDTLRGLGYRIPSRPLILSPFQFGVPQARERVYIPGVFDPDNKDAPLDFVFEGLKKKNENSIYDIIESRGTEQSDDLSPHVLRVLECWDDFYQGLKEKTIGFPIWSSYFKPKKINGEFPKWKKDFILKNKQLYKNNKKHIDAWLKKWDDLKGFSSTEKKFEWQCGNCISSLWEGIIQFRPSGVRVKRPDVFPSLVALVQTPIIGKYKRRISLKEAARLQSFPDDFIADANKQQAYKQFGNSVNVTVIIAVLKKLMGE